MNFIEPIVTGLVFLLFLLLFPYKAPDEPFVVKDFNTLKQKYQYWESFAIIPLFILIPLITYLLGLFFWYTYGLTVNKSTDVVFLMVPNKLMWFALAGIFAFGLVWIPMDKIYKLILKDRYSDYIQYTNMKHNYDGMAVMRILSFILCLSGTVILFLMSDYSIKIYKDKVVLNDFATIKDKTYHFNEIQAIYFVENVRSNDGELTPTPHYLIKFTDKSYWNTNSGLNDELKQKDIIQYLSAKSNRKVETIKFNQN